MKKLTAIFIAVLILLSSAVTVYAYDEDLMQSITDTYKTALELANHTSFHGYCNRATAYQMLAMGIYKGEPDFMDAGNKWCGYYKSTKKTSGGYTATVIEGKDCLYDLISTYGDELYNIVYALGTGGTSGPLHVLYIRAIINGYVYFADSFACTYSGVYIPEGHATVLTVPKFISSYKSMNGDPYGCVYFTVGAPVKKPGNIDFKPGNTTTDDEPGDKYVITASLLNVRSEPNTDSSVIGHLSEGQTVTVTEAKNGWGKIKYNGYPAWISLEWADKVGNETEDLRIDSVTTNKEYVTAGDTITWTAKTNNASGNVFYAFDIYRNEELVNKGTYGKSFTCSFKTSEPGYYQVLVTVVDESNSKAELYSDPTECVPTNIIKGDVNGDGKVKSDDARLALRMFANLEKITMAATIAGDIDGNGKISATDARRILRAAIGIEKL